MTENCRINIIFVNSVNFYNVQHIFAAGQLTACIDNTSCVIIVDDLHVIEISRVCVTTYASCHRSIRVVPCEITK